MPATRGDSAASVGDFDDGKVKMPKVDKRKLKQESTAQGPYTVYATYDGMKAYVFHGSDEVPSLKFDGETAWSDAIRQADDLNLEWRRR